MILRKYIFELKVTQGSFKVKTLLKTKTELYNLQWRLQNSLYKGPTQALQVLFLNQCERCTTHNTQPYLQ